ncbi:MAG: hypothetical protein EPO08_00565 [Rhodospirillaceae bacterium]|nr:MAG: hypothetical protein EPO08_00565 [Rhodospirillaceae bacterium]
MMIPIQTATQNKALQIRNMRFIFKWALVAGTTRASAETSVSYPYRDDGQNVDMFSGQKDRGYSLAEF